MGLGGERLEQLERHEVMGKELQYVPPYIL